MIGNLSLSANTVPDLSCWHGSES